MASQNIVSPAPKRIWKDAEIPDVLKDRNVLVVGYGNQGRPQALNLRDSGLRVKIGARAESQKRSVAEADGFEVLPLADALRWADIIMLSMPDDVMADAYAATIAPHLRDGQAIGFVHGLVIHAGWVKPAPGLNVFLAAPKAQGKGVRSRYEAGGGVPGLFAVHQDPAGNTANVARAYLKAIGCGRVGIMETTFAEETICDLFSEQAVLCGGLTSMIKAAFDTLVDGGYSPEVAYFECLYEVKLVADLLHERGLNGMRRGISSTAQFGDVTRGERVINDSVRQTMKTVLSEIESGQFASEMLADFNNGNAIIQGKLAADDAHLIERTHHDLRARLQF